MIKKYSRPRVPEQRGAIAPVAKMNRFQSSPVIFLLTIETKLETLTQSLTLSTRKQYGQMIFNNNQTINYLTNKFEQLLKQSCSIF